MLELKPCADFGNPLSVTRVLPFRRQSLRAKRTFVDPHDPTSELKLYVTVGIDPADGKVGEIFARSGGKAGKNSMMHRMLDAGAIMVSHLLQRGMTLEQIAAAIGNDTPLAEVVKIAIELQAEIDAWPPGVARAAAT